MQEAREASSLGMGDDVQGSSCVYSGKADTSGTTPPVR